MPPFPPCFAPTAAATAVDWPHAAPALDAAATAPHPPTSSLSPNTPPPVALFAPPPHCQSGSTLASFSPPAPCPLSHLPTIMPILYADLGKVAKSTLVLVQGAGPEAGPGPWSDDPTLFFPHLRVIAWFWPPRSARVALGRQGLCIGAPLGVLLRMDRGGGGPWRSGMLSVVFDSFSVADWLWRCWLSFLTCAQRALRPLPLRDEIQCRGACAFLHVSMWPILTGGLSSGRRGAPCCRCACIFLCSIGLAPPLVTGRAAER